MAFVPSMLPAWKEAAAHKAAHEAVDEQYSTFSTLSAEQQAARDAAHEAVNVQFGPTPVREKTPMTPENEKKLLRIVAAGFMVACAISAGIYIHDMSAPQAKPAPQTTGFVQQGYNVSHNRATLLAANMLNAKPAARADAMPDKAPTKNENHTAAQLSTAKLLGVSEGSISALFPHSTNPAVPAPIATSAAHEASGPGF